MFLEIINSCITHTVHLNVHLVHVMLCHKDEFDKFRELESFKPLLQVTHYFTRLSQMFVFSCTPRHTLQEEDSDWNLNFAISLMANSLNSNSVYYYILRNLIMIASIFEIQKSKFANI